MNTVKAVDVAFEYAWATEILNIKRRVIQKACTGCQDGRLSQRDHTCLSASEYELLGTYMNDILGEVNVTKAFSRWESIISRLANLPYKLVSGKI